MLLLEQTHVDLDLLKGVFESGRVSLGGFPRRVVVARIQLLDLRVPLSAELVFGRTFFQVDPFVWAFVILS